MFDPDQSLARLQQSKLAPASELLVAAGKRASEARPHGLEKNWRKSVAGIPVVEGIKVFLDKPTVAIGERKDLDAESRESVEEALRSLHPWRKGPFDCFGIHIDAEWRSDWKWARLEKGISPLAGRTILDVGCGNGYYLLRMLGEGAEFALGIEPSRLFIAQFQALSRNLGDLPATILPLRMEELPLDKLVGRGIRFDTVFSMGILYHRRDPVEHLESLAKCLTPDGELVLETLVLEGEGEEVLYPEESYAKMPNVWSVPTEAALRQQLESAGFTAVETLDLTRTTTDEQRATSWMTFHSLADFLDPDDPDTTIEGYPAPLRIMMVCRR